MCSRWHPDVLQHEQENDVNSRSPSKDKVCHVSELSCKACQKRVSPAYRKADPTTSFLLMRGFKRASEENWSWHFFFWSTWEVLQCDLPNYSQDTNILDTKAQGNGTHFCSRPTDRQGAFFHMRRFCSPKLLHLLQKYNIVALSRLDTFFKTWWGRHQPRAVKQALRFLGGKEGNNRRRAASLSKHSHLKHRV